MRWPVTRALSLVPALACVLGGEIAHAHDSAPLPAGVKVEWSGAPGCPDQAAMEGRIGDELSAYEGEMQAVLVIAVMARGDGTYILDLTVETPTVTGAKRLEHAECEQLARATTLVAAIAVKPGTTADQLQSMMTVQSTQTAGTQTTTTEGTTATTATYVPDAGEVLGDPTAETPDEAPATSPPEDDVTLATTSPTPVAPPRKPVRVDMGVRALGGGDAGVLPGFGGGAGLAVAALGRHWRVEGQFSRWFTRTTDFPGEPGVGASFDLWSGGVRGCGVPTFAVGAGQLEVPLCAGAELGQIHAVGYGAPVNLTSNALWAAAVLGPAMAWTPRRWIAIWAGADGLINLVRPGFSGQERPELHRTAPVAARVLAGLEFRVGSGVLDAR